MKVLYGYPYYQVPTSADVEQLNLEMIRIARTAGFDVEGFCLTLHPPRAHMWFPELDARWRRGDRELLALYERLEERLAGCDVLLNTVGINLHPEFVERLPAFTVFQCFDDPESSDALSKPVAGAYDLCLVGNAAEVETYRSWGVKHAEWVPMGLMPGTYDPTLCEEDILEGRRDIDLVMLIDRLSAPRRARMDAMAKAFPDAHFYGRGWPRGLLPVDQQIAMLRRAKIGPNFHNSTGPINLRLFQNPANGVMQICDNKSHLGMVYELGKEVVGFDTVEECVDLCRYYLAHDRQRREIALNGWRRAMRDYNEAAVFAQKMRLIEACMTRRESRPAEASIALRQIAASRWPRLAHRLTSPAVAAFRGAKWAARMLVRPVYRGFMKAIGRNRQADDL
jgi:spore maturation protein CgeB